MRRLALLLLCVGAPALGRAQGLQEKITVERVLIDARVTNESGEPITGLQPKNFRVTIDGIPAKIESADWIDDAPAAGEQEQAAPTPGRLLIFLFQTDFAHNPTRIRGQMQLVSMRDKWIRWLTPEDRVAVLSFDSHLKFRLDFTNDKEKIRRAMEEALHVDEPPIPPPTSTPSLGNHLDTKRMKNARIAEDALLILGDALRAIPGPKSLILFGWGLGHYVPGIGVYMDAKYATIRYVLERARVSIFSIDFTQADSHTLAAGMSTAARDTGGFYASTYSFPTIAVEQLQRTLSGHYELEVRKPDMKDRYGSVHFIEVDVPSHRWANVMARTSYVDNE